MRFEGLHQKAAAQIAVHLGLAFISDPVSGSNTKSVLPAYRTAVTAREIFYYLVATLEGGSVKQNTIPYPSEPEDFWTLVERGRNIL